MKSREGMSIRNDSDSGIPDLDLMRERIALDRGSRKKNEVL